MKKNYELQIIHRCIYLTGESIPDDWYLNLRDSLIYQVKVKFGVLVCNPVNDAEIIWKEATDE